MNRSNTQVPNALARIRRLAKRLHLSGVIEFDPNDQVSRYQLWTGGSVPVSLGNKASEARTILKEISGESQGK